MDKREADWLTKSLNHTHKAHPQLLDALEIVDKELDRQRERADKLEKQVEILAQRMSLYETGR